MPPPDRWDRRCCRGDLNNEKAPEILAEEQPKTTVVRASRRSLGGYRSEQRATPWVSPGGGCCRGDYVIWETPGNLKKEQPKTTVVRASRRGLGGYRSDQRATPWVSWWWLVVPVEAGCWEKKKKNLESWVFWKISLLVVQECSCIFLSSFYFFIFFFLFFIFYFFIFYFLFFFRISGVFN